MLLKQIANDLAMTTMLLLQHLHFALGTFTPILYGMFSMNILPLIPQAYSNYSVVQRKGNHSIISYYLNFYHMIKYYIQYFIHKYHVYKCMLYNVVLYLVKKRLEFQQATYLLSPLP